MSDLTIVMVCLQKHTGAHAEFNLRQPFICHKKMLLLVYFSSFCMTIPGTSTNPEPNKSDVVWRKNNSEMYLYFINYSSGVVH